jgi:signal peptidase I
MSEPERQLPVVTLPPFVRVVTDLFAAPIGDAVQSGMLVRFRAEGLSMYPAIRDGELITVGPADIDQVVRGDVLLCRHSTRVLAHRVVTVTGYGSQRVLQLRGDAKAACDAPVAMRDVIGKVLSVRRNGRTIAVCGRAARLRHRARTLLRVRRCASRDSRQRLLSWSRGSDWGSSSSVSIVGQEA